jgi:hypothetical protein
MENTRPGPDSAGTHDQTKIRRKGATMNHAAVDDISRHLRDSATRRGVLRMLGGAVGLGLVATAGLGEAGQAKAKKITICYQGQTRKAPKRGWQDRFRGATRGPCRGGSGGGSGDSGRSSGSGGGDAAVVASYCARSGGAGSSRVSTLGQPFIARQAGRLDRVDLHVRSGPGGPYVIEVRDLDQGQGISSAPVIGSAAITVPAIAQGEGQRVTARFASDAVLVAGDQYALLVRFLGEGNNGNYFQTANGDACIDPGVLLVKSSGETSFTPYLDLKLEYTVYVVP